MKEIKKRKPGGERKPLPKELHKVFVSTSISGSPEEIHELKRLAFEANKSVSRFVLDALVCKYELNKTEL